MSSRISCKILCNVGSLGIGKISHLPVRVCMGRGILKEKRLRYTYISRDYKSQNSKGVFRRIGRFRVICVVIAQSRSGCPKRMLEFR
jgi:hypothetical protein